MADSTLRQAVEEYARLEQHGSIHRHQARARGMSVGQIDRRLRHRQWMAAGPQGWYVLVDRVGEPLAHLYPATVALTAPAWAHSALALFGFGPHPPAPMVATARRYTGRGVRPVYVEGLDDLPRTRRAGIETVTIEVAVASQCRWRTVRGMHVLVDEVLRAGATTWDRLLPELERFPRSGRAGSGRLRSVVADRLDDPGVPLSDWGRDAARHLERAGLVGARVEHRVLDDAGRLVAQVDLAFPDHRYAVELDSVRYHANLDAFEGDRERDAELARAGWRVRRFTWRQWTRRLDWVLDTIRESISPRAFAWLYVPETETWSRKSRRVGGGSGGEGSAGGG